MSLFEISIVLFAGLAAGFINTLAGGGSLIAMSALIFMGLPSAIANGTNRIAVLVQNIVAVTNFKRKGFFDLKLNLKLAIPAVIGAVFGSSVAITLPEELFNKILAGIMFLVLGVIILNPTKDTENKVEALNLKQQIIAMIAFFFVGIYGGFIQAGVGFMFIVTLSLITDSSLVKINSIKVFVIAAYTISSLVVFITNGKINWLLGIILAVGNSLGAYLGSNFAIAKGDRWIKVILIVLILAMALRLLINF
ncbi:putative permease [Halobacteroides halobius DSM 5150]|uniref:Probable membrane transporter protein n=1 Tax=Halobacteroides halobius (strain ATCC 35273 / DSM 5150 / MD-1) TaxID=748449 RepID=L0K8I9_HALHC|nr:sulfite exporter TauE/SafE family protein [Halobacteroides halobius]AGB40438.1 putative permease [Halobacteroides halobius DSM 5150]